MDANPNTGVLVIDSYDNAEDFLEVGGTSLASPMFAATIDLADGTSIGNGGTSLSTTSVQNTLYGTYNSVNYGSDFHDITTGNNGFAAGVGYDLATGIGSPKDNTLVPVLAAGSLPPATTPPVSTPVGNPIHIGLGATTTPIVTSIPTTQTTVAVPSLQDAMPSAAKANVTTTSMAAPSVSAVSVLTDSVSNSSVTSSPVNNVVTAEGSQGTVGMTTTEFASIGVDSSLGADADGSVPTVALSAADGSADAAVPAMLSGNVSDFVFADHAADSIFDRMADAPVAVASSTEDSHAADIALLAGAALAVYGYRSTFTRSEEKVRMLPVLA